MILKDYNNKINSSINALEKECIIAMLLTKLTEATIILFPKGIYRQIKWYQFNRWIMLGKIMYDLIKLIMKKK